MKDRKARNFRPAALALVLVLLGVFPAVAGAQEGDAARRARVLHMLDLAGMKPQIEKLGGVLAAIAGHYEGRLSPGDRSRVSGLIARAYSADKVYPRVVQAFDREYNEGYLRQAVDWLGSPLGRKMTAMEVGAGGRNEMDRMKAFEPEFRRLSPERRVLIEKFSALLQAENLLVTLTTTTATDMILGIQSTLAPDKTLSEEQVRSMEQDMRRRLRGRYTHVALLSLAYTYRGLSDEDLRRGVEFYATEAGRWLNRVGNRSLIAAMADAAREVGRGLGEILREKTEHGVPS